MYTQTDNLGLTWSEFALLRDLIHERTGLCYEDGKNDLLADRLSGRVIEHGFSSFLDYYYLLKYDAGTDAEWMHIMDALSVPESFFWREFDQVQALVDVIVPHFFAGSRALAPLRIWSAACAGGEEPLTIAMALDAAGWLARAPIQIMATDASPAAIARARKGVYRERAFRNLPPELRSRYFTPEGAAERVAPRLQEQIEWGVANLMASDEVRLLAQAEVIFCRNVFIYFSERAIRKVVETFERAMPRPGYLFLGSSESLLRITSGFELQEIGGALGYVKP